MFTENKRKLKQYEELGDHTNLKIFDKSFYDIKMDIYFYGCYNGGLGLYYHGNFNEEFIDGEIY